MKLAILNHDGFVTQLDRHRFNQFQLFGLRLVATESCQVLVRQTRATKLCQKFGEVFHLRRCQTNATMRRKSPQLGRWFAAVN